MSVRIESLTGDALAEALPQLARLRIEVFRAFPYLYEGSESYEARYLAAYAASPGAIVVGAFDGAQLVGAATAAPLEDHAQEFAAAFTQRGHDLHEYLYFGESVLLPAWRGRGIGHSFFDRREAQARALARPRTCFCAVIRPAEHPARPRDYRPLDAFWRKRGYRPMPDVTTNFSWTEVGETTSSAKPMQFWSRDLLRDPS